MRPEQQGLAVLQLEVFSCMHTEDVGVVVDDTTTSDEGNNNVASTSLRIILRIINCTYANLVVVKCQINFVSNKVFSVIK